MEIVTQGSCSRGDDAAQIGSGIRNDVESDRGAEIDDYCGTPSVEDGGGSVCETVCSDF